MSGASPTAHPDDAFGDRSHSQGLGQHLLARAAPLFSLGAACQIPGGIHNVHPGIQQVGGGVDPLGDLLGSSSTTIGRDGFKASSEEK